MAIISVPFSLFTSRCDENGVTEESLAGCVTRRTSSAVFVDSQHPDCPAWLVAPKGLGDITAEALTAVGITKERVSRMLGRPCNCKKRQQAMNEWGKAFGIG
jgi:hypothetical protein